MCFCLLQILLTPWLRPAPWIRPHIPWYPNGGFDHSIMKYVMILLLHSPIVAFPPLPLHQVLVQFVPDWIWDPWTSVGYFCFWHSGRDRGWSRARCSPTSTPSCGQVTPTNATRGNWAENGGSGWRGGRLEYDGWGWGRNQDGRGGLQTNQRSGGRWTAAWRRGNKV